jgi:hypothetical protein
MEIIFQIVLALLLLAATGYVQMQIPAYTKGRTRIGVVRLVLGLVGVGFGLTAAAYVSGNLPQLLAFLIGFGMVHFPAAVVLFLKGKRGEGKS